MGLMVTYSAQDYHQGQQRSGGGFTTPELQQVIHHLRQSHPEVAHWTDAELFRAWLDFSEHLHTVWHERYDRNLLFLAMIHMKITLGRWPSEWPWGTLLEHWMLQLPLEVRSR